MLRPEWMQLQGTVLQSQMLIRQLAALQCQHSGIRVKQAQYLDHCAHGFNRELIQL